MVDDRDAQMMARK